MYLEHSLYRLAKHEGRAPLESHKEIKKSNKLVSITDEHY